MGTTQPSGLRLLAAAMQNRKTAIMFVFGFAAGLPYTLLLGTLYAWLGEEFDLTSVRTTLGTRHSV